jgi:hypothetical protein
MATLPIGHSKSTIVPRFDSKSYPLPRGRINPATFMLKDNDDISLAEHPKDYLTDQDWPDESIKIGSFHFEVRNI